MFNLNGFVLSSFIIQHMTNCLPQHSHFINFFEFPENVDLPPQQNVEDAVRKECCTFLSLPSNENVKEGLKNFPFILKAFIKYSTPLPSSAPVERLFNYAGMVLSPKRRKLTDKNFEQATLLKVNNNE